MNTVLRILFGLAVLLPLQLSAQDIETEPADSIPLSVLIDFGKALEMSVNDSLGAAGVLVRSDEIILLVPDEEVPALWEIRGLLDEWAVQADSFFRELRCEEFIVLSFTPDLARSNKQGTISMIPMTMTYACNRVKQSARLIVLRFKDEPYLYLLRISEK